MVLCESCISYLLYLLLVDDDLEKVVLFNIQVCAGRCGFVAGFYRPVCSVVAVAIAS